MQVMVRQSIENHILSRLSCEDLERLHPHLEPVTLAQGQVLHEAGDFIEWVYFPQNMIISLISYTAEGESVEVGMVGFEGIAGISAVLGVDKSPYQSMVQIPNGTLRMRARRLREEFKRAGAFQDMLLRYTQGLLLQTSQIAACNRLHALPERLARWLLMASDRCPRQDLPLTQESLAMMLGVRRAGVTETAIVLQAEGCIAYRRGNIRIIDRELLEQNACPCYQVIKAEFDLLTTSRAPAVATFR